MVKQGQSPIGRVNHIRVSRWMNLQDFIVVLGLRHDMDPVSRCGTQGIIQRLCASIAQPTPLAPVITFCIICI